MIRAKKGEVSAQSQAMPSQMSEGWIGVVGDFFNDRNASPKEAQKRLYDILMQR
ncbi:glucose/mannose transport system substrate-binding protein [Rhizobium leucaenae]|uniref:Glucose/mannose transport system substrate-binding protein n=1 Tax=Rhizobium leucaenae TaxID=29450 RepID=A0A7W6ZZH3_9HYPH|nr:glucose/mannose transport system substrate-binding protein [Rhizobium leucaenae]MBB6303852.1 glucose/mannose transport system substrate-binding protein [Rhizobium leucaenae]